LSRQEPVSGWAGGRQVTALIPSYTEMVPEIGQPHFSVMAAAAATGASGRLSPERPWSPRRRRSSGTAAPQDGSRT
jgi:hypothetical protein